MRQRPASRLRRRADPRGFPDPRRASYGKPLVYLDNAASAQKPQAVLDRIDQAYTTNTPTCIAGCIISPTRRPRPTRRRARRCGDSSMPARKEEIIFTRNATEAINLVASRFGRERIKRGRRDRALDHGAPFQHRAVAFPARAPGRGDQMGAGRRRGQFPRSTNSRSCSARAPRWSPITHMSNMLGTLVPVKEVTRIAHARGIPVLVDGAQGAVHVDVDVRDIDLRFLRRSPATSSTARPASACSTASTSISRPCRRSTAAAR